MARNYFDIIKIYNDYFTCYMPPRNIKSAWYRFYFFLNPKIKNYKKIRFQIIKYLNKSKIKCFTGACPEIYLEKSFRNFRKSNFKRLKNCQTLGNTSLALDVNHTLTEIDHKKELYKLKINFQKIFNNIKIL